MAHPRTCIDERGVKLYIRPKLIINAERSDQTDPAYVLLTWMSADILISRSFSSPVLLLSVEERKLTGGANLQRTDLPSVISNHRSWSSISAEVELVLVNRGSAPETSIPLNLLFEISGCQSTSAKIMLSVKAEGRVSGWPSILSSLT